MRSLRQLIKISILVLVMGIVVVPLYALPATLSLGWGRRPGLESLTISQAVLELQNSGDSGWQLVETTRALVAGRMGYSRRNSFDSAALAFDRGYGYCTQQAFALAHILGQLGFEAQVVQAFQNRFPDGTLGSHAWVRVRFDQETREIDTIFYDPASRSLTFRPLSTVTEMGLIFKLMAWWGGTAVNAHRYYLTGKDE